MEMEKQNRSTSDSSWLALSDTLGVFLLKMKNAFVPVKRDHSVNTYSRISTVPWGSERSEWASPWTEWASEAEQSGALRSEGAEWAVRANKRSKRRSGLFITRLSLTRNAPSVLYDEIYDVGKMRASAGLQEKRVSFWHTYRSTDVWKFTTTFYRTYPLWICCPERGEKGIRHSWRHC